MTLSEIFFIIIAVHVKLGLSLGNHQTQHASYNIHDEKAQEYFPLRIESGAKPSVLYHLSYGHRVTASLHSSQYHSVCAIRIPLQHMRKVERHKFAYYYNIQDGEGG